MMFVLLGLHGVLAALLFGTSTALGKRGFLVAAIAPAATLAWLATQAPRILDGRVTTAHLDWVPRLGLSIDTGPGPDSVSALFRESSSRFVCELAVDDVAWLAELLDEPVTVLGRVVESATFTLPGNPPIALDQLVAVFGAEQ